ncbi:MAG: glycosyltransferase family 2 protein [bacterium]|nr:glycosyltransferase family 2 protein [bacterium]
MSSEDYKLSIVTVLHNSFSVIASCLNSIPAAAGGLSYEVIVVDNNSSDNGAHVVTSCCPEAVLLTNDRNLGFAAACNQGAARARGEFLLFLNPDVIADPGSIFTLVNEHTRQENPGGLTARMRYPEGKFQSTSRRFPTMNNLLFSRQSFWGRLVGSRGGKYTLEDYRETTAVEAVAGTMLMIRRDLFERQGKFDERFFLYMEDTDLSYRLKQNGFSNYFVPSAGGQHAWGTGSDASKIKRHCHHHYSMWKYFLKHYPNGFSLILLPLLLMINLIFVSILDLFRR